MATYHSRLCPAGTCSKAFSIPAPPNFHLTFRVHWIAWSYSTNHIISFLSVHILSSWKIFPACRLSKHPFFKTWHKACLVLWNFPGTPCSHLLTPYPELSFYNLSIPYLKCIEPEVFPISDFFGLWDICIILTNSASLTWKSKMLQNEHCHWVACWCSKNFRFWIMDTQHVHVQSSFLTKFRLSESKGYAFFTFSRPMWQKPSTW